MREIRIYAGTAPLKAGPIALKGPPANHLNRVLRRQVGDPITLFDGEGRSGPAIIRRSDRDRVELEVLEVNDESRESGLDSTLAVALIRGESMDRVIQNATELGVTRIQPLLSERTVVRLSAERAHKRLAHWQRLVASACEQCGRNTLPIIEASAEFREWLRNLPPVDDQHARLIADPDAARTPDLPAGPLDSITLLVGPEGGFSSDELGLAQNNGFEAIWMGPRVLRAATAATALLSVAQWRYGDLGPVRTEARQQQTLDPLD